MQSSDDLRNAYRVTFQDYADKLNTLQQLIHGGKAVGAPEVQSALHEVETARAAHSSARDCLARQLMGGAAAAPGNDRQIRRTARLIWEFAGRPEGTAERDWRKAERLAQAAAC